MRSCGARLLGDIGIFAAIANAPLIQRSSLYVPKPDTLKKAPDRRLVLREPSMAILWLLLTNTVLIALCTAGLWGLSVRLRDVSFIDGWWPIGMVLLALASYAETGGSGPHAVLLTLLCAIWGLRLGGYLLWRWRKQGADPRYEEMLGAARAERGWSFAKSSLLLVFALQAPLQLIVALPVQLGQVSPTFDLKGLAWTGAALTVFGIAFESLGDWQLLKFKADPANKGKVMDRGLWRYTRHPNYFGEACVWWGLYLIAAETGIGAWSMLGPILITALLTKGSGVPTVEGRMKGKRPGYDEYVRRTSGFIPWFPKAA
jgi:steroid 5-alpha reductase family enzyme